jgi:hypothetical protein
MEQRRQRDREQATPRLAAHLGLVDRLTDPEPRPPARERLDAAAGPELARLLVPALSRSLGRAV